MRRNIHQFNNIHYSIYYGQNIYSFLIILYLQYICQSIKKVDKYQFNTKDLLGQGSFGCVYKAQNLQTKELFALKMVPKIKVLNDDYAKVGLLNEINIMKKLKSPNIVQLVDVLETSNNYYIIQELCEQNDLQKIIKKKKIFQEWQAIQIMSDILRGFTELIKHGVIHRDLKPANILISGNKFKLADFGFAKTVDNFAKQQFFSSVGTPLYMSPQILSQQNYTTKSDIWSFGFIFYELLYGITPWTASSIMNLIQNINKIQLTFHDQVNSVSQQTKDIIQRCLQIEENDRIAWIDIYKHPSFASQFQDFQALEQICFQKEKFIVNRLREKIEINKIELLDVFVQFDLENKKCLDMNNFKNLIIIIDPDIQRLELEYIFNNIDKDSNGTIDFNEFKDWLIENNVRLSVRQSQPTLTQLQSLPIEDDNIFQNEENGQIITYKLKCTIDKYKLDIKQLYDRYDRNQIGKLNLQQYQSMIKKIDPSSKDHAIQESFQQFIKHSQQYITFFEFKQLLDNIQVPQDILIKMIQ